MIDYDFADSLVMDLYPNMESDDKDNLISDVIADGRITNATPLKKAYKIIREIANS